MIEAALQYRKKRLCGGMGVRKGTGWA